MNGLFTFTKQLKYLGSYISYNLRNDFNIEARIMSTTKEIGDLKEFRYNNLVDNYSKHLVFLDIPTNILLWGCESWSLHTTLKNKL